MSDAVLLTGAIIESPSIIRTLLSGSIDDNQIITTTDTTTPITTESHDIIMKTRKSTITHHHPSVPDMVIKAITDLKEKKGSSLQAIKKYIETSYNVDVDKHQAIFIKKALAAAVSKNIIIHTKGIGATGSFRLATKTDLKKINKASSAVEKAGSIGLKKTTATTKKSTRISSKNKKKSMMKKTTTTTTTTAANKKGKTAKVKKTSSSKVKKMKKTASATKPKTPRPKKTTASKAKAATK